MPATPTIFSTLGDTVHPLFIAPRHTFFERMGKRLTAWIDTFAPEGYEDEAGFHPLPSRSSVSRAPHRELNCLGEHI